MIANWNLIPMNKNRHDDHFKTAETLLEFEPQTICPGHGGPFEVTRDDLVAYREQMSRVGEHFQGLVGDRSVNQALDFHWARVFPYEQQVEDGSPIEVTVRIRNYDTASANGALEARVPKGWSATPSSQAIHIHAGGEAEVTFSILPGPKAMGGPAKVPFAFALELGGKVLGEVCNGIGAYSRII